MAFSLNHVSLPTSSNGASPTSFTVTSTVGNFGVLAVVGNSAATVSAASVGSSPMTPAPSSQTNSGGNSYLFYLPNAPTGQTTVSVTHASTGISIAYYDFTTATGGALDTGNTAGTTGTTANPSESVTPSAAGVVIAVTGYAGGSTASAVSSGTLETMDANNITNFASSAYLIGSGGSLVTMTFTVASPTAWSETMASFIEAAAPRAIYILGHT